MTDFNIKLGCDPEIFVYDGNHPISAFGLVEGTKEQPQRVEKGYVQVDGMALEFNIDPASNEQEWMDNIETVIEQLREMIPRKYSFRFEPVAVFGKEYLANQPDVAKELGCNPDWNAWTGAENNKPNAEVPFRTASGHVHIGWTEEMDPLDAEHFAACRMLAKQLDVTLGISAKFWDYDTVRQSLYGAFGAFRPKPYGCEYRVLSNRWLSDTEIMKYVYRATVAATQRLLEGVQYFNVDQESTFWAKDNSNQYHQVLVNNKIPYGTEISKILEKGYRHWIAEAHRAELTLTQDGKLLTPYDEFKNAAKNIRSSRYLDYYK